MLGRDGYSALPLGDFDRFQQSSFGFLGEQKGCLSPERGGVGPGAGEWPPAWQAGGLWYPQARPLTRGRPRDARCAPQLALLPLPWPHQLPGLFAAAAHLPHFWLVCPKGRIRNPQGPGMVLLLPFLDSFQRVDLRTRAFNVPPCKLASKDGAVLSVGADVQFRIWDPVLSVMTVKDLNTATRMTAQNAMTKALLRRPLREIQMEKPKVGEQLLLEINEVTRAWGLEVDRVELAVEAVLQPPQDSPAGPSLDSTLQQLALHLLGGGMNLRAGSTLPPGPALPATSVDTMEMVSEVQQPAVHAEAWAGPSPKQPVAEGLLVALQPFLSEALVSQVGACYQFNIVLPGGAQNTYFLDLTTGSCGPWGPT
ncbi:stomatin-like protein 1 isoform X3 [Octodon degus]|uniref:Stomatin-like protein 1 isoform X3 n=1 Tax=Octodon degus TaxID=10160 RepID=A0A6P6E7Z7_OCTDE|nr:stomatin-like protein 1 isoform X3 [Octodon degus]